MRNFFKGVLRLATAILLVGVVVGLPVWGIRSWLSYQETRRNAALETPQEWPKVAFRGTEASLSTMWRDGWMFYKFEVEGGSKFQKRGWLLEFIDSNGFQVFKHSIRNASHVLDHEGKVSGFEARGQTLISADDYRRVKSWELSWID